MECTPELSILPSGVEAPVVLFCRSTLNVRSLAAWYSGLAVLVMPCIGRSKLATMKHASANWSAMKNALVRSPPRPCCTIATGQPAAGLVQPPPAALAVAFGTVTSSGMVVVPRFTGTGLKRVMKRLVWSSGSGGGPPATQNDVRNVLSLTFAGLAR